jgi:hypothetical protein
LASSGEKRTRKSDPSAESANPWTTMARGKPGVSKVAVTATSVNGFPNAGFSKRSTNSAAS